MIRSRRRPIVFPQSEHARLAGILALAWRDRPQLPFASFVAGVSLHDRGYGVLDHDDLDAMSAQDRWLDIQRAGFAPRGQDPVIDLIVALHVRRLVGEPRQPDFEAALPSLLENAGVDENIAAAADAITRVCDSIALQFCYEEPHSGRVGGFSYQLDGAGTIRIDPWPFVTPTLVGLVGAYHAETYPQRPEPLVVQYEVIPQQV
jgi:Protein of unknown function (DUF3891)